MSDQIVVEQPKVFREMKFIVRNLPKFTPGNQVRKFLAEQLKIPGELVQCKKAPKWDHALVTVKTELTRDDLTLQIEAITWKKQQLKAFPDDGTIVTTRKIQGKPESAGERNLNDQVTPLWKLSYEEQLALKQEKMKEIVDQVTPCRDGFVLDLIKPSPVTTGYRNKCEFSFGFDKDGQPCVGFSLGGFREGTVTVANASDCLHVPDAMKALANAVQAHVQARTEQAPVFDRATKSGFWRLMMVRLHQDKLMVVVQVQEGHADEEEELKLVAALMESFEHEGIRVGSFSVQSSAAVYHGMDPKAPYRLMFGSEKLIEELDGLSFEISPSSFFQVNKPATLVLYSTIKEYVSAGGDSVLLDLCCGTGTIGMMMAPHVSRVIGVELVPEAVEDAKRNAALNGITNIEFKCARVEDAINEVIQSVPVTTPIAVVLDPPRSGIHKSVIKAIRNCERISSLVYVSCNPAACLQNYADLGKEVSRSTTGRPFVLESSVPVDMFPQTEHCELILKFTR